MTHTYTQFVNLVETFVFRVGKTMDFNMGEWDLKKLHALKNLDIIEDILNFLNNDAYDRPNYLEKHKVKLTPKFSESDKWMFYVLENCPDDNAAQYIELPVFKRKLKSMFLDAVDPQIHNIGGMLARNIEYFKQGKIDNIWFKTTVITY